MGIGEYYRYLPLLFTYRTISTFKPLGAETTKAEDKFLDQNDERNLEKIGSLLSKLPHDLVFIFKAMHIIGVHNKRAGGSTRDKLLTLTNHCIKAKSKKFSYMFDIWLRIKIWTKIFLFENALWLYKSLFGFLEVTDI
jgi:aarF domain-containing kinase